MKIVFKKYAVIITLALTSLLSVPSYAGLISLTFDKIQYSKDEAVMVDVWVNNINPAAAEMEFTLDFNETALAFNEFNFTAEVLSSTFISDSFFDVGITNSLTVYSLWFSSIDVPVSSFKLASAVFTSLVDTPELLNFSHLYVADDSFNELSPQVVSEPASALLMLSLLGGLLLNRKVIGGK